MKTLTLYCDKDLVFRWNEWPENNCVLLPLEFFEKEAEYKLHVIGYNDCFREYHTALELAKRESKPFENQRLVKAELICHINDSEKRTAGNLFTMSSFQPDTFYSFPFEGEVKKVCVVDVKGEGHVARLIPESKEESQEELWTEVINDARWYDGSPHSLIEIRNHLINKRKLFLTRKHP